MIVFGLTGGICCGKSTVSKTFRQHQIPVIDADVVARQVVEPDTPGLLALIDTFGSQILLSDGTLNREQLGKLVFQNPTDMRALNLVMAPLIRMEAASQIRTLQQSGHRLICFDAALIIEVGHADLYRPLIVVSCPQKSQLARLMKRNSLTEQEAMSRINVQLSTEEKIKLADHVIDTSGSIEDSIQQTVNIIMKLRQ